MKQKWLIILAFMITLTACSTDVKTEIIGMWKGESLKQDLQFHQDGRVVLTDRQSGLYQGSYTITRNNLLTCEFEHILFTKPVVRTVKISGDKLVLKKKSGYREIYQR
jgi:hypothetical protein